MEKHIFWRDYFVNVGDWPRRLLVASANIVTDA